MAEILLLTTNFYPLAIEDLQVGIAIDQLRITTIFASKNHFQWSLRERMNVRAEYDLYDLCWKCWKMQNVSLSLLFV